MGENTLDNMPPQKSPNDPSQQPKSPQSNLKTQALTSKPQPQPPTQSRRQQSTNLRRYRPIGSLHQRRGGPSKGTLPPRRPQTPSSSNEAAIVHNKDYPTPPWPPGNFLAPQTNSRSFIKENPLQHLPQPASEEDTAHCFYKRQDSPYVQDKTIRWIRVYH